MVLILAMSGTNSGKGGTNRGNAMDGTNKGQDMGLTKGRIPSAGSSDF